MCSLCGVRPAMSLSVTTGFFVSHADGLTDGWMDGCLSHLSSRVWDGDSNCGDGEEKVR